MNWGKAKGGKMLSSASIYDQSIGF